MDGTFPELPPKLRAADLSRGEMRMVMRDALDTAFAAALESCGGDKIEALHQISDAFNSKHDRLDNECCNIRSTALAARRKAHASVNLIKATLADTAR